MRVLAAADIHGNLAVYEWLAQAVRGEAADLLLLPGDLFAGDLEDGQREQAGEIVAILKTVPAPVFYIMGNDDNVALGYGDERIVELGERRNELSGFAFVGYPYCLPFVGGPYDRQEDEIERDLEKLEPLLDGRTVFVSHSPAYGIMDSVHWGGHCGSRAMAGLLNRKPVLAHIHGHIHKCFGRVRNRFNVACGAARRAILIDLPSLEHKVLSAEGSGPP